MTVVVHQVRVTALPGVITFDLASAVQVLADEPWAADHPPRYDVAVCAPTTRVATSDGFDIGIEHGVGALQGAETVVVPGYDLAPWVAPSPDVLDALRAAASRGARMMSICTGAFALGHWRLLDGRRATTHWAATRMLAARFPGVEVVSDVLYVDEGDVLTSAGLAGGLDLALHLVRRDHGAHVAAEIARWNVLAPHRDGAQAQFASTTVTDERGTTLADVCAWARELLERTDRSVEEVARDAGFPTAAALRARFAAALGTTPTDYRRRFARRDHAGGGNRSRASGRRG